MPIDPSQLRTRAAEIAVRLNANPAECAAAVHRVLDDYADRSHRYSPKLAERTAPIPTFKTPPPVVRAILTALRKPAQEAPAEALATAKYLWAKSSREERRIAVELLGLVALRLPTETLALIESWVPELESATTANEMTELALSPLLPADPPGHLYRARQWLKQPNKWARYFGVMVIAALAKVRGWDDVPSALDILRGLMTEPDPSVRQAVIAALNGLAPRNLNAMTRFLREHAQRSNHHTHTILRATLKALPAAEQAELVKMMRS